VLIGHNGILKVATGGVGNMYRKRESDELDTEEICGLLLRKKTSGNVEDTRRGARRGGREHGLWEGGTITQRNNWKEGLNRRRFKVGRGGKEGAGIR